MSVLSWGFGVSVPGQHLAELEQSSSLSAQSSGSWHSFSSQQLLLVTGGQTGPGSCARESFAFSGTDLDSYLISTITAAALVC